MTLNIRKKMISFAFLTFINTNQSVYLPACRLSNRTRICVRGLHVGVRYEDDSRVLRQTGNYMQEGTSWRGRGGGQESVLGWVCTAAAYCRNVNPPNVLQLEEEQDHRLNRAFGSHRGGGRGGGGSKSGDEDEKVRQRRRRSTQ